MTPFRDNNDSLYFIALIPGDELKDRIRAVKERLNAGYHAGHALKSPAHITLQMPFKRQSQKESAISVVLAEFALKESPFTIVLDGFGCFAPRVIFIRIVDPAAVKSLHFRLKHALSMSPEFSPGEIMNDVQPHITVATRDLTKEAFREAWPVFKDEKFSGSFVVRSLFLLKHNGKNWDILSEFPFGVNG